MQVRNIPVADIVPSDLNPRKTFDQVELQELADSIKENGLVQPITIRKKDDAEGKYEVVCGERRLRAFQLLGEETIPSVIKKLDDRKAFAIMIIENLQRKDINPMEEAHALKKLYDDKAMTVAEMAKLLGKSSSFVVGRIQLSNIIPEFVDLMNNGPLFLVHLLDICKLPQESQVILYENCFTPECVARWTFHDPKMSILRDWINTYVMNYLDTANFDLADDSFDGCSACATCALNTKNNAESFKDSNRPRCMKRECFLAKQRESVFREAMTSALPLVYSGSKDENKEILATAESKGLEIQPVGKRTYVVEPSAPDKDSYNDEETYQKRLANYLKVREAFDSNLADGTIEKVFEVAFSGKISGEAKFLYTAPSNIDTNNAEEVRKVENTSERITELKKRLAASKRDREIVVTENLRKHMEGSDYSTSNEPVEQNEMLVFLALVMKRLSYSFKERIGFGLEQSVDYRKAEDIISKNQNAIMREFIAMSLSEKSVCFSSDLGNMLSDIMQSAYPDQTSAIVQDADENFAALANDLQKQIDDLRQKADSQE